MNDDFRNGSPADLTEDRQVLEDIRTRIAECDLDIAEALTRRMDCVEEIINYKKKHGMVIFQGDQEKKQRHILRAAVAGHKHEEAILGVYQEIIKSSRRVQAKSLFPKNIFLIGFMGSGKTTVSGCLGRLLEMEEADTDRMIVNWTGLPVKDLFAQYGEEYFRDLETTTLRALAPRKQLIISCGGGMTLRRENVDLMRENGVVVWLTATPETVYERVHLSMDRPLLNGHMNIPYIRELMASREERYRNAADVAVPTDGLTILEICELLTKRVLEFQNRGSAEA